ncbi:alpha/beta fold hydrolase [Bacillus atrophaeus]|uniref:alpha/beta fold hydrolase n=1 Tax=Bacillus atrophaeus TaxID=1452 RepID=UPI002E24602C|nr:alpha/beta hydrolase [Bacillus atrophaeus]
MCENNHKNLHISILKKYQIGNTEQVLMINGANRANPLLLFLHGGPGTAQIGYARHFQKELEQHFTVVNWDQRGAGLSYSKQVLKRSMTIRQFTEDAIEIAEMLVNSFKVQKIYLAGYSWGALLALTVLQTRPDLFYAYYGISQVVNVREEEQAAYRCLEEMNHENKKSIPAILLRLIGPPPWNKQIRHEIFRLCIELRRGGFTHKRQQAIKIFSQMLFGKEYGVKGCLQYIRGQSFSSRTLMDELYHFDAFKSVPSIKVPCCFISGRHDLIIPGTIPESYCQRLSAPDKSWHWFENSAHSPHLEEPKLFADILSTHGRYHL